MLVVGAAPGAPTVPGSVSVNTPIPVGLFTAFKVSPADKSL